MGRQFFRPAHRDAAEPAIIDALRAAGASVHQLNGKDILDLLVGYRGVTYLLEVKSRLTNTRKDGHTRKSTTKVSAGQMAFMESWKGGPTRVVHTPEEALYAVGAPMAGVIKPLGMETIRKAFASTRDDGDATIPVHPNSIAGQAIRRLVEERGIIDVDDVIQPDGRQPFSTGLAVTVPREVLEKVYGHAVTPAYQKTQTEAVVPKKKPGTRRKSGA